MTQIYLCAASFARNIIITITLSQQPTLAQRIVSCLSIAPRPPCHTEHLCGAPFASPPHRYPSTTDPLFGRLFHARFVVAVWNISTPIISCKSPGIRVIKAQAQFIWHGNILWSDLSYTLLTQQTAMLATIFRYVDDLYFQFDGRQNDKFENKKKAV